MNLTPEQLQNAPIEKLRRLQLLNKIIKERTNHSVFNPLYTSKKRYFLITGGRGSLKSTEVHKFIIKLIQQPGHGVLFTRYTMKSAELSIIPQFEIILKRMQLSDTVTITKNKVVNKKTGSFIIFSGIKTNAGDQTANLKSIPGITTFVVEEGEDFNDEKTFNTIDDSVRSMSGQNRVIWIQNPSTKEHVAYKRWIEPNNKKIDVHGYSVTVSNMPEVEHIHCTYRIAEQYLESSWLAKKDKHKKIAEAIPEKKDRYKTHYYNNYIGGWLEVAEGAIFENWSEGEWDESLSYCYGQDYGYNPDPTTLVRVAVDQKRKKIYIEEKFYELNLGAKELLLYNKQNILNKNDVIVADSAEKREINDLKKAGLNMVFARKPPGSVKSGLKEMEEYEIIVCGDSPNAKIELNNYVWNNKKAGIPIETYNHIIDPSRYSFDFLVHPPKPIARIIW